MNWWGLFWFVAYSVTTINIAFRCGRVWERSKAELDMTSDLLAILDLIELATEDQSILDLTRQRHDIAREHGYTVEFGEPVCGEIN